MIDINLNFSDTDETLLINNPYFLFIQEIELAVEIIEGTIWNRPEGLNINKYLFNKYINEFQIKAEIETYITQECVHSEFFNWNVEVMFLTENGADFLLIDVIVHKDDDAYHNKFLIS